MTKTILMAGAAFLVLAVILGAFGAHGLKPKLTEDLMQVYKTGVEYHFYHALGLLLIGILTFNMPSGMLNWAAFSLGLGIVLFSGSLYLMAVTGIRWLGAITPFGGVSFIAGWVLLLGSVWKNLGR